MGTAALIAAPPPAARGNLGSWLTEARRTVRLAIPLVLTLVCEAGLTAVDIVMIGRLGQAPLAGASLGITAFFAGFVICFGITLATHPLAAQAHGAGRPRMVRRVIRQGLWVTVLLGVICALALGHLDRALLVIGQPEESVRLAQTYIGIAAWGLIPMTGFGVLRGFAAVVGRPHLGLWLMIAALPANAALDYALIFGAGGLPALGIAGAAVATVVVQTAMCLAMLVLAVRAQGLGRYRILGRFWRPDWHVFGRIFALGVPVAGIFLMEFGLIAIAVLIMGWIGPAALAAHQVAILYASLAFRVAAGIAQAATVRVGDAAGRRDAGLTARAGWTALALGSLCMIATSAIMLFRPETLARLVLGDGLDAGTVEVATLSASLILVAAAFQVADGAQAIGAAALRGLSDTRVPLACAAAGYFGIGAVAAYMLAFPAGLGAVGVWLGLAAGLGVVAVMHVVRFRLLTRRGYLPEIPGDR